MEQKNKFIYILPVMFGFFIMGFCDLVGISVTYAKGRSSSGPKHKPAFCRQWYFCGFLSCLYLQPC